MINSIKNVKCWIVSLCGTSRKQYTSLLSMTSWVASKNNDVQSVGNKMRKMYGYEAVERMRNMEKNNRKFCFKLFLGGVSITNF